MGPKFASGGPVPPGCQLAEKNFVPEASTLPHLIVFLISISSSNFRDNRGTKFTLRDYAPPPDAP